MSVLPKEAPVLTRLVVKGFKNLVDVDLRLGPFTCVAGPNGAGKSNVFDAILFFGALADMRLVEAAMAVRGAGSSARGIANLFTSGGTGEIHLEAEMLIPHAGVDDLGQKAEASSTFVSYAVTLGLSSPTPDSLAPDLTLLREELRYIPKGEARRQLPFPHERRWRDSLVYAKRRRPYITTGVGKEGVRVIKLHQDKGTGGRARDFVATSLPRTVLSTVNAQESPTAVLAKQEMRSWRLLQLEPSALRAADDFQAPSRLSSRGEHLPSALYRLARIGIAEDPPENRKERAYATLANKLAELIEGVESLHIDRDDKRELLTLVLRDLHGTELPASSLSDGTLRFIALGLLEMDPEETGLLCFEEPENGIHPERVHAMLQLLQDIAVDVERTAGPDNPLRQVIINTHSPSVVAEVPEGSLLFAETAPMGVSDRVIDGLTFRCLADTWRAEGVGLRTIPLGTVKSFLMPVRASSDEPEPPRPSRHATGRRVCDHVRQLEIPFDQSV